MKRPLQRFVGLFCLSWLFLAVGCGDPAPPPASPRDDPEPTAAPRAELAPAPEAAPDITVAEQELRVEPAADPGLEVVRRYTQMFYSGETEKLREKFSEEMKAEFPPGRLEVMRDRVELNLGKEVEVVGEDSQIRDDYRGYVRWARFSKHEGVVEIQWVLRPDNTIAGFIIREAQDDRP